MSVEFSETFLVHPKLLAEQFDEAGTASVSVTFAGKQFHVTYRNTDRKDYGSYHIAAVDCDKTAIEIVEDSHIMISREFINNLSSDLHETYSDTCLKTMSCSSLHKSSRQAVINIVLTERIY